MTTTADPRPALGGDGPVPVWHAPPGPRWWRLPLVLLAVAAVFGLIGTYADHVDSSVSAQVRREATQHSGSVTAVLHRDETIRPSVIEVRLDAPFDGVEAIGLRTSESDDYHVGQRVVVEYDAKHPGLSAIKGDENGPTWTLGAETIGILGGIAVAVGAVITGFVLRRKVTDPLLRRGRRLDEARTQLAAVSPPFGPAPVDPRADPRLQSEIAVARRRALRAAVLGSAATVASGGLLVAADELGGAWHLLRLLAGILFFTAAPATYLSGRGARAASRWGRSPGPWFPATALFASDDLGAGIVVATDAEHGAVYRLADEPVRAAQDADVAAGAHAVWVSGSGKVLAIRPTAADAILVGWTGRGLLGRDWSFDLDRADSEPKSPLWKRFLGRT